MYRKFFPRSFLGTITFGTAFFVIGIKTARDADLSDVDGVILAVACVPFIFYTTMPVILFLLVYKAIFTNLKDWAMYIKEEEKNANVAMSGLDYIRALHLGNQVLSNGCFYFCSLVVVVTILILYRAYSFFLSEFIKRITQLDKTWLTKHKMPHGP